MKLPDWTIPIVCLVLCVPLLYVGLAFDNRHSLVVYCRLLGGLFLVVGILSSLLALPAIAGVMSYLWHKKRKD